MQQIVDNGNLTPGIHTYSLNDFKLQFVDGFTQSESRQNIFTKFRTWLNMLLDILPPRYMWLDGSYITNKVNPNDIDLIVFYAPEDFSGVDGAVVNKLQELISQTSRMYSCDAYFCFTFDFSSEEEKNKFPIQTQVNQTYWMGQFSYDRQRNVKGIVQINKNEIYKTEDKEAVNS